jgi:hypothetical protein
MEVCSLVEKSTIFPFRAGLRFEELRIRATISSLGKAVTRSLSLRHVDGFVEDANVFQNCCEIIELAKLDFVVL